MQVCRQARAEATPLYYSGNTFEFSSKEYYTRFEGSMGVRAKDHIDMIHSVVVKLHATHWCTGYCQCDNDGDPSLISVFVILRKEDRSIRIYKRVSHTEPTLDKLSTLLLAGSLASDRRGWQWKEKDKFDGTDLITVASRLWRRREDRIDSRNGVSLLSCSKCNE